MKKISLLIIPLLAAVFVFVKPANATIQKAYVCHCQSNQCQTLFLPLPQAVGHLREHDADYAGVCVAPSTSPTASPTTEPSATPQETVAPSESPEATASPTVDASATPQPTDPSSRTDLSDNRSDGHTESLGCQRPEDGCGRGGVAVVAGVATLPDTGSDDLYWLALKVAAVVSFLVFGGWIIKRAVQDEVDTFKAIKNDSSKKNV